MMNSGWFRLAAIMFHIFLVKDALRHLAENDSRVLKFFLYFNLVMISFHTAQWYLQGYED